MKKSIFIITLLLLALTTTGIALAQAPAGKEYTVQPGDSLSAIAKAEYGNPQAFPAIVAATNAKAAEDYSFAVIKDPTSILVGQKLWLPVQPTPATTANSPAITATTVWPNLADYPHLVQAQLGNQPSALEMLTAASAACPEMNTGRQYPLAEPDYTGKRARDLSAFETALADFTPERTAALDALLPGKTIPELQSLLDSGDLTSAELVTYYVDRIRRYDLDKLNSVMELNPEALDIARALDAERAAGTVRGPMHGIPVLLKDNIATGDRTHTTAGAAALQDWVADRDAFLVQQIRAAGGLILGKANLSEWANFMDPCMPSGFSAVGGQTRHPYGPFDPSGSSSGSAVSVAANLTTVSVGSETSGSLIQPGRSNGVVALRPSLGLISRDYVAPLGPDLDTPGPMGRSLTDVVILLNAMTGVDPNDPKTGDAAALAGTDFTQFLNLERARGLRVGIVTDGTEAEKPAEIAALRAQGIEVVEINAADILPYNQVDTAFPQLQYGFQAGLDGFLAGLGQPAPVAGIADVVAFNEADMANRAPYGQGFVKWSAETGLTAADQAQILAEAQAYATAWMNALVQTYNVDVVDADMLYAANAGAAGVPALTIPIGLDATGKPASIILSGPYLSDPDLLTVGYVLEQALQGRVEPDLDAAIKQIETVAEKSSNLEKIACPEFISISPLFADEVEGKTFECGLLAVPENYAAPAGRTIELAYLRLFSLAETPAPDPLLYLSGGPGGSAVREAATIPNLRSNLQAVRATRDIVFYDQRGTGLSAPLNCGPVQAGIGAAIELLPEQAAAIQAVESDTEKAQVYNVAVCAGVYGAAGVDLAHYNSIASAKDMAGLMTALGYEQYNLYGTSYGTKLAQVALRETPERIRQAVLDGTSPVSQPQMANSFIESNEQYVRLFAQCAADPACNAAYPNLPDRFTALLNRLKDNPIALEEPIKPVGLMTLLAGNEPINTIAPSFFNTLININNTVNNHDWGDQISIAGQIPRTILALEEDDIEYVRGVFVLPDIGAAPADEVQAVSDESRIHPDNDYVAPTIDALLAEAQKTPAVASASTPEQQWVALVINHLAARLQNGDKQTEVISDMIDLTFLPAQGRDPQLLIDYANELLPEDVAAQANALVAAMTPADVRTTMWHLNEVAEAMRFNPEDQPGFHEEVTWAVNCAEDVSLRSADVLEAAIAAAAYPQLAQGDRKSYEFLERGCSFFPKTVVAPNFVEPVVSDTPVLFIQGDLDAATPPSQAREVASHLTNVTFVLFGSEGHVVASKTPSCPGTIAAQFLDNPPDKLDTSCADAFRINFELP